MRLNRGISYVTLALVAGLLAGNPAAAKQSDEPVSIGTFAGAFLAARVAETDNDLSGAIAYYRQALTFDPGNESMQQSLLLALISNGEFDAALPYADKLAPEDRWAVVAYVRSLQRAQQGKAADVADAAARQTLGLP